MRTLATLTVFAWLAGCACPSSQRAPRAVRLEPRDECLRATVEYCRRVVSPFRECVSVLAEEFCE